MLEAVELTRLIVNKTMAPERRGRGRKGYCRRPTARLLVYAQLKGIHNDKSLENYLKNNRGIAIALGLKDIPDAQPSAEGKRD